MYPGKFIIKECYIQANELRELSRLNEDEFIEPILEHAIIENNHINDRVVGKMIQIMEA